MSDHETESFTPYEPQTSSYDWDYAEGGPGGEGPETAPNILWGRLVALGILVIVVFLIGRWSAPNGVSEEDLAAARADVRAAQEKVDELEAALTQPTVTPSPSITAGTEDDTAVDATFDGKTYTVVEGDTMREIADRFCGDPSKDDVIADFNNIADPTLISVGTELKIPEDCAG